jgi:hypothetical protein
MRIETMPLTLFPADAANPLAGDGRTPLVMFGPARGRAFIAVAARTATFDVRQLTPGGIAKWACNPAREWDTLETGWLQPEQGESRPRRAGAARGVAVMPTTEKVAAEDDLLLMFAYPRQQDPVQALYEVEEAEAGLPPALATALLAAVQCPQLPNHIPGMFGTVAGWGAAAGTIDAPRSNRKQILQQVDRAVAQLATADPQQITAVPPRAVDAARFWLALARRLWEPEVRRQLARAQHALAASDLSQAILQALMLAMGWLILHDIRETGVAGSNLAVPQGSRMGMLIWPQVLELDDGAPPTAALRFLVGGRLPEITAQDLAQLQALEEQALDADLARGISATLVAEAAAHPAYAPEGSFRLELPAAYPLSAVTRRLRLWVTADRLWCAPEGTAGVIGVVQWRPGRPLARRAFGGQTAVLLESTLAAVWHDLHVAGPQALPELAPARPAHPSTPDAAAAASVPLYPRGRTLPAPRHLVLAGQHAWGTAEERAAIQRQAHGVRGHLRRLLAGARAGEDAVRGAQGYGLAVPAGFTFVRPHVRGGQGRAPDQATAAPALIRARGLATVMTLLQPKAQGETAT